jgi:ABC-type lipoprotein release transport system permease subunit
MVYLPLKEAQMFFAAPERLNSLILMVDDERVVDDLAESLRAKLDDEWYAVKTWEELLPDAVAALEARDAQVKGICMDPLHCGRLRHLRNHHHHDA